MVVDRLIVQSVDNFTDDVDGVSEVANARSTKCGPRFMRLRRRTAAGSSIHGIAVPPVPRRRTGDERHPFVDNVAGLSQPRIDRCASLDERHGRRARRPSAPPPRSPEGRRGRAGGLLDDKRDAAVDELRPTASISWCGQKTKPGRCRRWSSLHRPMRWTARPRARANAPAWPRDRGPAPQSRGIGRASPSRYSGACQWEAPSTTGRLGDRYRPRLNGQGWASDESPSRSFGSTVIDSLLLLRADEDPRSVVE